MKRKRKFLYMLPDAIVGKTDCANYKSEKKDVPHQPIKKKKKKI